MTTPAPVGRSAPGRSAASDDRRPTGSTRTLIRLAIIAMALLLLVVGVSRAEAGYRDLMGFPELEALLGSNVPTGFGIGVTHVESAPSTGHNEFNGKFFVNVSEASTSTHATRVGRNFYGNNTSIAPGIGLDEDNPIRLYSFSDWVQSDFLRLGQNALPLQTNSRVANHSYIAATDFDSELLRRFDYVVERDDYIQVAGVNNGSTSSNQPLWSSAYNVISVGVTNGNHATGTAGVDSTYTAGRVAPTLVTPGYRHDDNEIATSWATPMVSAAVALLLETGQDASLSNNNTITNRTREINHAETSEIIRAVLMAGADRYVINPRGDSLTDYTADTTNNLDSRYGAGQMNIYNSYRILAGGEQDAGSTITTHGWDYNPAFGGDNGTASEASYFFTPGSASETELLASLVWNLDVNITPGIGPFPATFSEVLHNLDLFLYDVTLGEVLLDSSESTIHNSEHIWFDGLLVGRDYELRVVANGTFEWDYGLAWQIIPEPGTGALLLTVTLLAFRRSRRPRAA
ncbi:S8 family serine peptidase [Phycisphaerales bacterium AB-hyl4]|uniref:S8 family serine peptidase n=1 Tax=Natronomicrosphaera hydrolytica TaxID=3242702 RepID=A0ABV4U579_9BACT